MDTFLALLVVTAWGFVLWLHLKQIRRKLHQILTILGALESASTHTQQRQIDAATTTIQKFTAELQSAIKKGEK